ncbi:hypothetical protein [Pseudomonas umsongensis]|uniref:hypothetical protein n=1 Tax=Pseudomonas umsongensis TaxID=198618 RepID=UPI00200B8D05|nr:hypothetical protein [Pseudomonas umsongensis]MCK8685376.1 hypothetical protein [Pseudomonas umsongensis]
MPSISRLAIQMMFLFALACLWAASSGWKQQVISSLERSHAGEVSHVLSAKKHVNASGNAGIHTQTGGTDIDPVASSSE